MRASRTINNWHIKEDGCVHVHASFADPTNDRKADNNDGITGRTSKVVQRRGRQVTTENGSTYVLGTLDPKIGAVLACIGWSHDEANPLKSTTSVHHLLYAEKLVYGSARNAAKLVLLAVANLRDVLTLPDADSVFQRIDQQLHSLGVGAALLSYNAD